MGFYHEEFFSCVVFSVPFYKNQKDLLYKLYSISFWETGSWNSVHDNLY